MFCKNCGKELSDGALLCPDCGEPTATDTRVNSTLLSLTDCGKLDYFAVCGFTGSLISVACWVLYLVLTICSDYLTVMTMTLGIVTGFICLSSLSFSIKGIISSASSKNRAFALTGIILSAAFFTGFALLTCIAGVLFY